MKYSSTKQQISNTWNNRNTDINIIWKEYRVIFLKISLTNAALRSFWNIPVLSNRLVIRETTGTLTLTQYGRSLDRTGSERQVDFGGVKIELLISAVVSGLNEEKIGAGWSEKENRYTSINRFAQRN